MQNNWNGRRQLTWPAWLVAFVVAAVITGGTPLVFWWQATDGLTWWSLLVGALLGLTAGLGIIWFARVRVARRWNAAVDAYAEREIARSVDRQQERAKRTYSRRNSHARPQSQTR